MGCGYPPKTLEKELEINNEENEKLNYEENQINKDISFILHQKLEKFIKINPFYNISLSEFEETINAIKNNNNNEIIDKIISTFFKNEKSFVKSLFIKTVECAIKKYDLNLNTENINNDLIVLIIVFIYILLTDNKQGKRDLFRKNILALLNNKIESKDDINNKYKIEDIYIIIINIVQMHTFFFQNFFLYFAFSEIFINDKSDYEKIINEDSTINKINSFIESYLNKFNENMSFDYLNFLLISEINNKIKQNFEYENENGFITLDENQINGISDAVYETINVNNFISFIFFAENHIY